MQDLIKQEQFEIEVLGRLNTCRLLDKLVFVGGTMLRLCFGLDRFSVDLDFWLRDDVDAKDFSRKIIDCLKKFYEITDFADKFYTILVEIRSPEYPRRLKIEIRKDRKAPKTEKNIAYSQFSNSQIFLTTPSLEEILKSKAEALLERKEIRDAFDMEFLIKKGVKMDFGKKTREAILKAIGSFSEKDYKVKLSSLLSPEEREYYQKENFKILKIFLK